MTDLIRGAHDGVVAYCHRKHCVDEVGKGRHAVHEDPEAGEDVRRCQHTAEDQAEGKHELSEVACSFCGLNRGYDHVCEGGCEEEELPDQEEHEATAFSYGAGGFSVLVQPDGIVPAEEDENCHERVPWELDDDVGDHEGLPGVCF